MNGEEVESDDHDNGQTIRTSQMWKTFTSVVGEVYPAFRDMDTFKHCWESFYRELQQEPCSTLFHCSVAILGVLPFCGFILFVTGTFLLTLLFGSIAFCCVFFSGLLVFVSLMFGILVFCVWLSLVLAGVCRVWMNWPHHYTGEACTIRKRTLDKLAGMGFGVRRGGGGKEEVKRNNNNPRYCGNSAVDVMAIGVRGGKKEPEVRTGGGKGLCGNGTVDAMGIGVMQGAEERTGGDDTM